MNKKVIIVIILVLLIAVIGGVAYYFMMPSTVAVDGPWTYIPGIAVPIRLNKNKDIECLSKNFNCLWQDDSTLAIEETNVKALINNIPADADAKHLACGTMHRDKWGSAGYNDAVHWCFTAMKELNPNSDKIKNHPCYNYTPTSSNISRECILDMWKNTVGCPNSNTLASGMIDYYAQITKPVGSATVNGIAATASTLASITADARLWASLSTTNHREACYGTDMTKWPKNLLKTQADYEAYSNRIGSWPLTNVKAVGAFVKINPGVLDTERAGIIMGNYPDAFGGTTGNSQLNVEMHVDRKPRIFINNEAIDWKVNDPIPLNTWTHIAFVMRADRIDYYRNGVLIDTLRNTAGALVAPPILARVPNIKYGYDNRPNSLQQIPNKIQVSNLLISQGTNSVAWSTENVAALFANYKPAV